MTLPILQGCGSPKCKCAPKPKGRRIADPQVVGALQGLIGYGKSHAQTAVQLLPQVRGCGVECDHIRRIGEAVAFLVASGEEIASCSRGYYRPLTVEEYDEGARTLGKALAGLAKRYRTYDRTTADRILSLLGQSALDLSTEAAA